MHIMFEAAPQEISEVILRLIGHDFELEDDTDDKDDGEELHAEVTDLSDASSETKQLIKLLFEVLAKKK